MRFLFAFCTDTKREMVLALLFVLCCSHWSGQARQFAPKFEVDPRWPYFFPPRKLDNIKNVMLQTSYTSVFLTNVAWVLMGDKNESSVMGFLASTGLFYSEFKRTQLWPHSPQGMFVEKRWNILVGGNAARDRQITVFNKSSISHMTTTGIQPSGICRGREGEFLIVQRQPTTRALVVARYDTKRALMSEWIVPTSIHDHGIVPNIAIAHSDGYVYVVDPAGSLHVLNPDTGEVMRSVDMRGKYGSLAVDVTFSPDLHQTYLYVACSRGPFGVQIFERLSLLRLDSFGAQTNGVQPLTATTKKQPAPGEFTSASAIASDHRTGDLYVGETDCAPDGCRLQRFAYVGLRTVAEASRSRAAIRS